MAIRVQALLLRADASLKTLQALAVANTVAIRAQVLLLRADAMAEKLLYAANEVS